MSEREETARIVGHLRTIPLFGSLTERQLKPIAKMAVEKTIPAGAMIVHQGDKGTGLYMILDGEVSVEKDGHRVATLKSGQYFGEMALLLEELRTADVLAIGPVRVLQLSRWEFWGTLGDQPDVIRALLVDTVRRLRSNATPLTD